MKSASDWSQKILDDLRYYNTELPGIIHAIQTDALASKDAEIARLKEVLEAIKSAWETLPGGRDYKAHVIESWLAVHMTPAVNKARAALSDAS